MPPPPSSSPLQHAATLQLNHLKYEHTPVLWSACEQSVRPRRGGLTEGVDRAERDWQRMHHISEDLQEKKKEEEDSERHSDRVR